MYNLCTREVESQFLRCPLMMKPIIVWMPRV